VTIRLADGVQRPSIERAQSYHEQALAYIALATHEPLSQRRRLLMRAALQFARLASVDQQALATARRDGRPRASAP